MSQSRATTHSMGYHSWKFLFACFTAHTFKGDLNSAGETLNIFYSRAIVVFNTLSFYSSIFQADPKIKQSAHLKHGVASHVPCCILTFEPTCPVLHPSKF